MVKRFSRSRRPRKGEQLLLPTHRRGGRRRGAGRPRKAGSGVGHHERRSLKREHPLHVTLRVLPHVGNLRRRPMRSVIYRSFAMGKERFGFRLVHFSLQRNHIHLVCEADNKRALSRGLQGLCIRIAKALNKRLGRKGQIFADRYHARALRTPRETRAALAYVLGNARHHGWRGGPAQLDPCSSAALCDGWRRDVVWHRDDVVELCRPEGLAVVSPSRWLLTTGWRRAGLLDPDAVPGST